MLRTIAFVSLVTAMTAAPLAAFAGTPSGYGTEGPNGRRLHSQAESTFQRNWNHYNQSKYRAEQSAGWLRRHDDRNPF
jgi:hypothetical protein